MMFLSSDLATWLAGNGVDVQMYFDAQSWDEIDQDAAVILTMSGGGPVILERTFDTPTVQVACRGAQWEPQGAEALAWTLDNALMAPTTTVIGTTYVISIDRVGSPPRLLTRDAARRNIFVCNYIFTAARTTF